MKTYFSPSSLGFYHDTLFSCSQMPADVVFVSGEQFDAVNAGIAQGKRIVAGDAGQPALVEPAPDEERLKAVERAWRNAELNRFEWIVTRHRDEVDAGVETTINAKQYQELLAYRQALREWPQSDSFFDLAHRPVTPDWLKVGFG